MILKFSAQYTIVQIIMYLRIQTKGYSSPKEALRSVQDFAFTINFTRQTIESSSIQKTPDLRCPLEIQPKTDEEQFEADNNFVTEKTFIP